MPVISEWWSYCPTEYVKNTFSIRGSKSGKIIIKSEKKYIWCLLYNEILELSHVTSEWQGYQTSSALKPRKQGSIWKQQVSWYQTWGFQLFIQSSWQIDSQCKGCDELIMLDPQWCKIERKSARNCFLGNIARKDNTKKIV